MKAHRKIGGMTVTKLDYTEECAAMPYYTWSRWKKKYKNSNESSVEGPIIWWGMLH
jgi:hypothetical protein